MGDKIKPEDYLEELDDPKRRIPDSGITYPVAAIPFSPTFFVGATRLLLKLFPVCYTFFN
ncbi:MAG: hypothetical protein GX900_05985 [Clostridiaceae bacterium]|nr:hypothetical protein [Clostridiaceae bacterium]